MSNSATPWTEACQASLSFTISQSWFRFMSTELTILSNYLILSCSPFLLPSVFLSIRVFSNEFALHIRWPKNWSFSFSISPSSEYLGLTGFISLLSRGLSRVFFSTTIRRHQFFGTQPSSSYLLGLLWKWCNDNENAICLWNSDFSSFR